MLVSQENGRRIEDAHEYVHVAVVVHIADCEASVGTRLFDVVAKPVRWPSGLVQIFSELAPRKAYTLTEGQEAIRVEY